MLTIRPSYFVSVISSFLIAYGPAQAEEFATIDRAIAKGTLDQIKAHLEKHPGSVHKGSRTRTPLELAVLYKKIDVTKLLLEKGADPNTIDKSKRTPVTCRNRSQ